MRVTRSRNPARHRSGTGQQISQRAEDVDGSLWVGTFDTGLYHIERSGALIGHFRHDSAVSTSLSNDDVRAVLDDQAGHLRVGTADGLDLLDRKTQQFTIYKHDKEDRDSLSDSFVMSLYQDTTGLVWIGTRAVGVSRWNPHSWELGGNRPAWLEGKLVTAFATAAEDRLWIGSLAGGLVRFDASTGEAIDIDSILHQCNALADRRVMALQRDRHGALWIGTMTDGLKRLAEGKLTSIPVKPGDSRSVSAAGIMALYEARNGLLWIGTHGGGADILDPSTGLVRQLPVSSILAGALSSENITSFLQDRQGNFWIGTDSGGLDLARADGTVSRFSGMIQTASTVCRPTRSIPLQWTRAGGSGSESAAAIVNAITSLVQSLKLVVTAEGVERPGQLEWLRNRGCHEAQGYLLSRPLTAADLELRFLGASHAQTGGRPGPLFGAL